MLYFLAGVGGGLGACVTVVTTAAIQQRLRRRNFNRQVTEAVELGNQGYDYHPGEWAMYLAKGRQ